MPGTGSSVLNPSHQAVAYFGYRAGYRLVHDAFKDPLFATFLLAYTHEEATPTPSSMRRNHTKKG